MGIKEQLAKRLPFTKAGKELRQRETEEEQERLRTKLMAESKKNIDEKIISYSELLNIGQDLDENGRPTPQMRERVIAEVVKEGDDLVSVNELKYGVGYNFWSNIYIYLFPFYLALATYFYAIRNNSFNSNY